MGACDGSNSIRLSSVVFTIRDVFPIRLHTTVLCVFPLPVVPRCGPAEGAVAIRVVIPLYQSTNPHVL